MDDSHDAWVKETNAYCTGNKYNLFIGTIEDDQWKVVISNKGCNVLADRGYRQLFTVSFSLPDSLTILFLAQSNKLVVSHKIYNVYPQPHKSNHVL